MVPIETENMFPLTLLVSILGIPLSSQSTHTELTFFPTEDLIVAEMKPEKSDNGWLKCCSSNE